MSKCKEKKAHVLSMAAERISPHYPEDSQTTSTLEPVKFTSNQEGVDSMLPRPPLDDSESGDDFFDAEDSPVGACELDSNQDNSATASASTTTIGEDPPDIEEEPGTEYNSNMIGVVNKSIILHILSQVRVGMDLTRFTLPAFLMEPRSLLHMYASLFGRPNMLTEVADFSTARERMIGVVKWFVGSLSASRKGPAPKKPYNPVLGETFHCYWDLPNGNRTPPDQHGKILVETGPFPQGGYEAFSFVAEQVSHHPPVSAFYGECPAKKMYVAATIGSKTKLTPSLAAKAQNTGSFRICLLEHDEEYVSTLPHGYVRGVLTVPWFEFGGECVVECVKSGHTANIVFHTKPFRGGKKHRVTAELRHKSSKEPYLYFEGEWDLVMYTREPDGQPTPFMEACTRTLPKKMKKLSSAEPTDSRVVWRHLSEAIIADDDQTAASAKHQVEETEREKVRERNRTGEVMEHKYFHQSADDPSVWEYNSPLDERLATLR